MLHWKIEEKRLELLYNWKISRNESSYKINFFINISGNGINGLGETAPNIRYDENPEIIKGEFQNFLNLKPEKVQEPEELEELLSLVKLSNSLRFGIESSFIHWFCRSRNISLQEYFQIPPSREIATSYTIPIMHPDNAKTFIHQYNLKRFKSLKIKIGTEELELVKTVANEYKGPLRIDANEAWKDPDKLMLFLEQMKGLPIEFIEQPFPGALSEEYKYLKKTSPYPVFGDESITSHPDMEQISQQFHGINMKLMKAGGYRNGIHILKEAKKRGLQSMIGCMVETSLGISCAMHLCGLADYADLDGHFVLANEPFDLVQEKNGILSINPKIPGNI